MAVSKQIVDLFASEHSLTGFRGRVEAIKRYAFTSRGVDARGGTVAQRQMIADLENLQLPEPPKQYAHPEQDARAMSLSQPDPSGGGGWKPHEISAADLAWIERLPTDPNAISYSDAVELAALAQAAPSLTQNRAAARLINSVWLPVKEVHDGRAAEVVLENARRPLPQAPSSVLGGLADTIAGEVPELEPDEVYVRASKMLRSALEERSAARDAKVQEARETVARVRQAGTDRASVVKVPIGRE